MPPIAPLATPLLLCFLLGTPSELSNELDVMFKNFTCELQNNILLSSIGLVDGAFG